MPLSDLDFTQRTRLSLQRISGAPSFLDKDSDTIFLYLRDQIRVFSFGDHLKRYLYQKAGLTGSPAQIPESTWISLIQDSFRQNCAPHSFQPTHTRWSSTVRRWLKGKTVERETVFLLGFGLGMTDQEVSRCLMKALQEQDFRFYDLRETVFWYCFHFGLPWAEADSLLKAASAPSGGSEVRPGAAAAAEARLRAWKAEKAFPAGVLCSREALLAYLKDLNAFRGDSESLLYETFRNLYVEAVSAARRMKGEAPARDAREDLLITGAYVVENALYSGVPRSPDRNLLSAERSVLKDQIGKNRLSRQRLGRLLCRKTSPTRFDLLTLKFLEISARKFPADQKNARERLLLFVSEANSLLRQCGLWDVYPVNPYESFLLLCLLTEEPLYTFNDVWQSSYEA